MTERKGRTLALLGAGLSAAACGGHVRPSHPVARRPQAPHMIAARRCAQAARLAPGVAFPAWHMGAVDFSSATSGVGITAGRFPCLRRMNHQEEVGLQRQPVRLASTSDGGHSWLITGATPPLGPVSGQTGEEIASTSRADLWVIAGTGRLAATTDHGSSWQVQAIPRPVIQIAASGGVVWALACPHAVRRTSPAACRPQLWHTKSPTAPWTRATLPPGEARDQFDIRFAATSSNVIVELLGASTRPTGRLFLSRDAGRRWTTRRAPTWDHNECDYPAGLAAAPPRTFWLLCLGGAAAGSSTKGLLESNNGGQTWTTVSAVTSLTQRPRPGAITLAEPSDLVAGSQARLWLSFTNGLTQSSDGGRRWAEVPQAFDPGGWGTTIDALSASHAWTLAPGAGMWRTTDGLHWRAIPPLNTG
jgi:photosystem II stability/assembly factor-like uncharacterized protein